jgi:hypothetical protein
MGSFPVEDSFGIQPMSFASLFKSRKIQQKVQFCTIKKFRSAFSNTYHGSVQGQAAMVLANDTRKLTATKCPT